MRPDPPFDQEACVAEALVVTFSCRSCGNQFKHESPTFSLNLPEIRCPVCLWSPQEAVKR